MIVFYQQHLDCRRCAHQKAGTSTLQISVTNCAAKLHSYFYEARKTMGNNFPSSCNRKVQCYRFNEVQALPLVKTRFLRLARISPLTVRSPARRSRDVRETSGKTTGEISRVMSAQLPGNGRAVAAAMPPGVRQDGSQVNLSCAGLGRRNVRAGNLRDNSQYVRQQPRQHLARRLAQILNHDIQKL